MSEDLEFVLNQLADESRPLHQINLAALSDVPRSQAAVFRGAWDRLSPARRLALVREMVEQAETNIRLNFYVLFRELLSDGDAQVRKLAVEGLWEDNRTNLVAPLTHLLAGDPVADVRAAAAMSLGRFVMLGAMGEINEGPAEQAEAALRTAWNRPGEATEVRRRALEGLASSAAGDVRQMIQSAYFDEDELLRQSAVYAMGRSADRRWARYVLAELASREQAMRFEAVVSAGELALGPAVDPLIRLLDDPDASVRNAAASALGQIGGPAARRALENAQRGDDEGLVEAAVAALDELSFNSGGASDAMFEVEEPATLAPAAVGHGLGHDGGLFDDDLDESFLDEDEDEEDVEYDDADLDWLEDEAGGAGEDEDLDWLEDEDDDDEAGDDDDDWDDDDR